MPSAIKPVPPSCLCLLSVLPSVLSSLIHICVFLWHIWICTSSSHCHWMISYTISPSCGASAVKPTHGCISIIFFASPVLQVIFCFHCVSLCRFQLGSKLESLKSGWVTCMTTQIYFRWVWAEIFNIKMKTGKWSSVKSDFWKKLKDIFKCWLSHFYIRTSLHVNMFPRRELLFTRLDFHYPRTTRRENSERGEVGGGGGGQTDML